MPDVKVYSTPTCPYCTKVKNFLKENNVEFKGYNVQENPEKLKEMIQKTGQRGVPVTDIDGEVVVGYNVSRLKQLLDLN